MRLAAIALFSLLAACGEPVVGDDRGVTANQLARLSTPRVEAPDPAAAVRLQPLGLADLDSAGMPDPLCEFVRRGRLIFAASSSDAIARIGGRVLHFTHSGRMERGGGFFEDRQISISIGRVGPNARIAVTNRRDGAQLQGVGEWRCLSLGGDEE